MKTDPFGRELLIDRRSWRERHAGSIIVATGGLLLSCVVLWQVLDGSEDAPGPEPTGLSQPEPATPPPNTTSTQPSLPETAPPSPEAETTTTRNAEVAECIEYYNSPEGVALKQIIILNANRDPDLQYWPDKEAFYTHLIEEACAYNVEMGSGTFIR